MTERRLILESNYRAVMDRIRRAEGTLEGALDSVQLLAVSKTYPTADIETLYHLGQRRFGENYLQEAATKILQLQPYKDIEWHFIGHLQSNKSKIVAEQFNWLHTLSTEKLAKRLSHQRPQALPPLNVLIQINIDAEPSKSGIAPSELIPLADKIRALDHLQLRGIMAIPARPNAKTSGTETAYSKMSALFDQLKRHCKDEPIDTLSMGMSNDLELAIDHNATLVRIGTDIFGPRKPTNAQSQRQ